MKKQIYRCNTIEVETYSTFKSLNTNTIIFLLVILFYCNIRIVFGQERTKFINHFGVSVKGTFTADGLGTFYVPSVFYIFKNNEISVGPIFQKNSTNSTGIQFNYEYTLVDRNSKNSSYCDWLELFSFINSNYHHNASLGELTKEIERLSNNENGFNVENVRLNTIETYAGIGLRIDLSRKLKWKNCIGAGGYKIFNAPEGLDHCKQGAGLLFKTGVSYQF